jgi:hypothetical protein
VKLVLFSFLLAIVGADLRAQLKADPSSLAFGRRQQEQVVAAEVKLTNAGATALEITGVLADCSCTVATPEKRTLAPGETTLLKISVETRAYQGVLHRKIHVQTSAGELTIPIELTVSLFKSWLLEPSTIVIAPSQKGREAEMEVTLQYTGGEKAELGKIVCSPSWLEAVAESADGKRFRIKLTKHADTPAGNFTVKVVVPTSDPVEPSLTFNVFVPVLSTLRVVPNPVVLPTVKVGQPTAREISLLGWSGTDTPRLELALGQAKDLGREGDKFRFEISVTPIASGPLTQLLQIYDGEKLEAEIPVILRAEPLDKAR